MYAHYIEYSFSVDEKINHWYEKTLALQGIHLELFNLSQANEKDYRIRANPGFPFLCAHLSACGLAPASAWPLPAQAAQHLPEAVPGLCFRLIFRGSAGLCVNGPTYISHSPQKVTLGVSP